MNNLEDDYPIYGEKSDSKVTNVEEKKELVERAFREKTDCPVSVWAHNFRGLASNKKTSTKLHCDLLVLGYLDSEGAISVGEVKRIRFDNYIKANGTAIDRNPFSVNRKVTNKKTARTKINKEYIKDICVKDGLDYRPYSLKMLNGYWRCIFWHPEYGYSDLLHISCWLKNKNDPFRLQRHDIDVVNRAKLVIFDNNLSNLYEVIGNKVIYSELGHKSVEVFCKLHDEKNIARIGDIEKRLTFNCSGCRKKDFGGVKRLQELKVCPELDEGSTVVALVSLEVNGSKTLKFGITSKGLCHQSDLEWLNKRYEGKVLEVIESYRCKTELEARKLEQYMLIETLKYFNDKVPSNFGGYTECRLAGSNSLRTCTRVFLDALSLIDS